MNLLVKTYASLVCKTDSGVGQYKELQQAGMIK